MKTNLSLLKASLLPLFLFVYSMVFCQTTEDIKQFRKLKIEKEIDSLITIKNQKKIGLEKIEKANLNASSQLKEKLNYDQVKKTQNNLDSIINVENLRLDSLKVFTNRDILLDSLYKNLFVKVTSPSLKSTFPVSMLTKEKLEKDFGKPAGNLSEIIRDNLISIEIKQLNELEKEIIPQEKFLTNGILFKIKGDYNQRTKLFDKLGIETGTENPCVLIKKEDYDNLRKSGARLGYEDDIKKADKIKDDEFVVVLLKYNIFDQNKAEVKITDKLQFVSEGLPIYLNTNFNYKYINCGTPISEKKLTKIKEGLKFNEIEFLNEIQQKSFWRNYFREWYLVKNYQNSIQLKLNFESKLSNLKKEKNVIDQKMNEITKELNASDSKNNSKAKDLQYEITVLDNQINQKDEKINRMIKEEDDRSNLIIEGDKNFEKKEYERSISNYEQSLNIRYSEDVNIKLKKAREEYAPILAKKQEAETLARLESDRLNKEKERQFEKELPDIAFEYLKEYLKAPSTARYQKYAINKIDNCRTIVTLEVDAQNVYGAYLRSSHNVFFSYNSPCFAKEGGLTEVGLYKSNTRYQELQSSQLSEVGCGC
jgi:hypothetical protein